MLRYLLPAIMICCFSFTAAAQTKKSASKKKVREILPYYKELGLKTINGGLYFWQAHKSFLNHPRPISPILYFNPEMTVIPNVTAGLILLNYRYKGEAQNQLPDENGNPEDNNSIYPEDGAIYNHLMLGLKGAYHLNDIIGIGSPDKASKWDIYATGFAGYNFIIANGPGDAKGQPKKFRTGLGAGVRFLATENLAMYTELGLNSYGIGNVGLSYFIR